MDSESSDWCDTNTSLPDTDQLVAALGNWSYVLFSTAGLFLLLLGLQFAFLVVQFILTAQKDRLIGSVWVTSIHFVVSIFNLIGLALPKANDFLWLVYKIYVGISMGHFVDLTLKWYGGSQAMIDHVGPATTVNLRKPPCCCCLCLPRKAILTKNWIRFMKASVYQIPYTESFFLIILLSLQISGKEDESYNFLNASKIITTLLSLSFIGGLWGLFIFFSITHEFDLLSQFNYKKKSFLMKATLIIINFQALIIDICQRTGAVPCLPGHLSSVGVATLIKAVCIVIETFILGTISFLVYKDEGTAL